MFIRLFLSCFCAFVATDVEWQIDPSCPLVLREELSFQAPSGPATPPPVKKDDRRSCRGASLSRRDQAPLQSLRSLARLSRLGVAAASVPVVRWCADARLSPIRAGRAGLRRSTTIGCSSASPPLPSDRPRHHRAHPAPCARAVGVEGVPGHPLVAARQSVERQPPPDRGLSDHRRGSRDLDLARTPTAPARSGTTRRTGTSSSGAAFCRRGLAARWRSASRLTRSWSR